MLKKIMIDETDADKVFKWNKEKQYNLYNKINEYKADDKEIYLIGLDIAKKDSEEKSIMTKFRIVDDRYIYDGYEEV